LISASPYIYVDGVLKQYYEIGKTIGCKNWCTEILYLTGKFYFKFVWKKSKQMTLYTYVLQERVTFQNRLFDFNCDSRNMYFKASFSVF
jgi:hypothetical protein